MNRPPAFQFYPKDWREFKVQRMSLEAQGAYLNILCFMWNDSKDQCSILNDNNFLSRALGINFETFLKIKSEIQPENDPIFIEKDGKLISDRLKGEVSKQRKHRKTQSNNGKLGGRPKKSHGFTTAKPSQSQSESQGKAEKSSSSSSSSLSLSLSLNQKQKLKTTMSNSDEFRLANLLWDLILKRKPDYKKPDLGAWAKTIGDMIRFDGPARRPERIEALIIACHEDSFERDRVLDPARLRRRFDDLELKLIISPSERKSGKGKSGGSLAAAKKEYEELANA